MKCPTCGKAATPAELAVYGKCEGCYVDGAVWPRKKPLPPPPPPKEGK